MDSDQCSTLSPKSALRSGEPGRELLQQSVEKMTRSARSLASKSPVIPSKLNQRAEAT